MRYFLIAIIALLLFSSCDRPECTAKNEAFLNYKPHEQPYKQELARIIDDAGKDAFDYWIAGYKKEGDSEYMHANIQNGDVCAIMVLNITDNEHLAQFRKVKGGGYKGAGLSDLEYDIIRTDSNVLFAFKDVGWIVD